MRYFKDVTKHGEIICVWRSADEQVISKRADLISVEITEKEFDRLLNEGDKLTYIENGWVMQY
jgi:hypothetical protein